MGRIVVLLILGFVIYLVFRGLFRGNASRGAPAPAKSVQGEDMVQCARCGVNLPRSESREEAGRLVCADNPRCKGPA